MLKREDLQVAKKQETPAENKNVTVRTFGRKKKDGENA